MNLWLTEEQTEDLRLSVRVKETLFSARSDFQDVAVVDTDHFGRMLVLDGVFQTSIKEEFIYHEMIAHVPILTHPDPKRVLVIGGGDGGTAREVVKHAAVERATMVEIDGMVVDVAKKYLPETAAAILAQDPRLDLRIGDGIGHVRETENHYDIIIVDCSDPIGPGEGLFNAAFYRDAYRALRPGGIFVQQTESPFIHTDLIRRVWHDLDGLYPVLRMYLAQIPHYPAGTHSLTLASKDCDPLTAQIDKSRIPAGLRYFNEDLYRGAFALPNFVRTLVAKP